MTAIPNRLRHTGIEMPFVPDLSLISPGDTAMAACLRIDAGLFVLPVAIASTPVPLSVSAGPSIQPQCHDSLQLVDLLPRCRYRSPHRERAVIERRC